MGKCAKKNKNLTYNLSILASGIIPSTKRIGPHSYNVLCLLIGSLLGDGHMEKDAIGSIYCFYQKGEHIEYILWLHQFLFKLGYCKDIPKIHSRIIDGKVNYYCRFITFTFSYFNWIYDGFILLYLQD